jgi:DNA modification methylase
MTSDDTRNSINIWQRYASPVWMDINPSDTLQFRNARDNDDERHICPLQLDVIRRGMQLWSNAGDVVLSPFMGIGSEGHVAIEMGRRFVGIELKPSYYECAVKNLQAAVTARNQSALFTDAEATA